MTEDHGNARVHGYIGAWESNEPALIGALFTEDARYLTAPYRFPWVGREAIVAGWLERQDIPATNILRLRCWAFATTSPPSAYAHLWVIRLDA